MHKNPAYTGKQDATIQSMVAQQSTEFVHQITFKLSKKGIKISKTTLRRRFKQSDVLSMKPTSKPLLPNDDILKKDSSGI